jgi:hypothetical protein
MTRRFTSFLMAAALFAVCAGGAFAQTINVTEGTVVRVRLLEKLDTGSNLEVGSQINFEVADPVLVDDEVVIKPGARATGTITEAVKAKWGGRKGKLDFTIDYVEAVDGQNIRVRSTAQGVKGKGNVGLMAAGAILVTPLAIALRGKNAVVDKGTEFSIYTDQDREIEVN